MHININLSVFVTKAMFELSNIRFDRTQLLDIRYVNIQSQPILAIFSIHSVLNSIAVILLVAINKPIFSLHLTYLI